MALARRTTSFLNDRRLQRWGGRAGYGAAAYSLGQFAYKNRRHIKDAYNWAFGDNTTGASVNNSTNTGASAKRPRVFDLDDDRPTKKSRTESSIGGTRQVAGGSAVVNIGRAPFRDRYLSRIPYAKMPRYGGRYRRRGGYRRRTYRRGGRAKYVPRRMKGYMRTGGFYGGTEKKFVDSQVETTTNSSSQITNFSTTIGGQTTLHNITGGSGVNQRVGEKVVLTDISINMIINPEGLTRVNMSAQSGAPTSLQVSVWLILDTQMNGSPPGPTDIWQISSTNTTALMRMDNAYRFRTMKRWDFILDPTAATTFNENVGNEVVGQYSYESAKIRFYKKCRIPIRMAGTTAADSAIKSNALSLWVGTDGGRYISRFGTTNNVPVDIIHDTRVRYIDM